MSVCIFCIYFWEFYFLRYLGRRKKWFCLGIEGIGWVKKGFFYFREEVIFRKYDIFYTVYNGSLLVFEFFEYGRKRGLSFLNFESIIIFG